MPTPDFADLLDMIEERSAALRTAAADAGPQARGPGCPAWSGRALVPPLGEVHRFWAADVAAGPAAEPPDDDQVPDREPAAGLPTAELLAWSAASTDTLLAAPRAAGPDRPCWTWWAASGAPMTSGAVARHQVHEAAVHAFDAQEAAGHAGPLPAGLAADGIGEFLTVGLASSGAWPFAPARVALTAPGGPAWLVELSDAGAAAKETEP